MTPPPRDLPTEINDLFVERVCSRIASGKRVRRRLPVWGRIHIDRALPFLCIYRRPPGTNDAGTEKLVTSEASYIIAVGDRKQQAGISKLVEGVAKVLVEQFGACLILEIWSGEHEPSEETSGRSALKPRFRIFAPRETRSGRFLDRMHETLAGLKLRQRPASASVQRSGRLAPEKFARVLSPAAVERLGCFLLGLEIAPVYRDPESGSVYPLVLRDLRRRLSPALRRIFFEFIRGNIHSTRLPAHFHVLGRQAVVKAVWEVDRRLAGFAERFDFLLQLTPVNADQALRSFQRHSFQKTPVFQYRPLAVDPVILKRKLFEIPIERIEDPALAKLFRDRQDELDRQITMLLDINTRRLVHGSQQLYGEIDDTLCSLANEILAKVSPRSREDAGGGRVDARAFAELARKEISFYRQQWGEVDARVEIRNDIHTGLMVSRGSLLIGRNTSIPGLRAQALLQHEVGTHIVTYYNGRAQPFRQLHSGLAGYDELQEGIAVLAEYLVGGLSRPRLRLLAARVLAARMMVDGASFVETFRVLDQIHHFSRPTAFTIAMRIFRGGGLTKDAIYLRGLVRVLHYLGGGGRLEQLLVGKIALDHVPVVRELQWRGVLKDPPLTPRYLDEPAAKKRLRDIADGMTVLDLMEGGQS